MEKCRRCGCTLILATGTLERLKEHVSPVGGPLGEGYPENIVDMATNHTLTALSNVEETCKVDLFDVKTQVNLARLRWREKNLDDAFDHALEAASKFEMLFCKTRINGE